MSGLFNQASLVLVPSGYKSGKVYSEIPTNGDGDLDFTRSNDTATRVNSAGLIEKVRTNLVRYSEEFTNGIYWFKGSGTTVTANTTTAPNGTLTADTISGATGSYSFGGANTFYSAFGSLNTSQTYTFSVYLKGSGNVQLNFRDGNTGATNFVVLSLSSSWQRFDISRATASASTSLGIVLSGASGDFYIWGAQLEVSDFGATDYIPTTTTAVSVGMLANVPRLDYSGGGCPKLLLEGQRTNFFTYSEQFDNATWVQNNSTITANNTISPNGYINADRITVTSAGQSFAQSPTLTSGQPFVFSVFVKEGNWGIIRIGNATSATAGAWFNVTNGTAGTINGGTSEIEDYGNGWYRLIAKFTSFTTGPCFIALSNSDGSTTTSAIDTFMYVWGAQVEAGSYATSYIPTLGAAVTRGADACSKENIAGIVPTAYPFTLYAEGFLRVSNDTLIGINDLSVSDVYYSIGATTDGFFARARNSTETFVPSTTGRSVGTHKVAAVFTSSEIRLFANGALISTGANAQTFNTNATDVILGQLRVVADLGQRSSINEALVFNSALTDTQCIELTTL